MGIRGPFPGIK